MNTNHTNTKLVRCAIYTRKSTEEGLDQDFNSLDAQREAAESYIQSLRGEGWVALGTRYDDGGYSGGNTDRPALQRLMDDITHQLVDCVVVYKVDRLSRSLLDFTKLMAVFDAHQIAFVSVTQHFNTSNSMGRLMLNVLLSFAQFEREIIAERTRDKLSAMRRKGRWLGGLPPLGYDIDYTHSCLVVNPEEADRIRTIFRLYLELGSLLPVIEELRERGWTNKTWQSQTGRISGGRPFERSSLHRLLTNCVYVGEVTHGSERLPGLHEAIVDRDLFAKVGAQLAHRRRDRSWAKRQSSGSLLQGLLHCVTCRCRLTPTYTQRGAKRYRYYVCTKALQQGRAQCVSKSIPAGALEAHIVEQLRQLSHDPVLVEAVCDEWERQVEKGLIGRVGFARFEIERLLKKFDQVWAHLTEKERRQLLDQVIDRIDYDGRDQSVTIRYWACGVDWQATVPPSIEEGTVRPAIEEVTADSTAAD